MPDASTPCIYCWGRKNDPTFSLEHIWPKALGGTATPTLFRTDQVCTKCNNLCGQWVDGAFLKSWFIQNEGIAAAHRFLDPKTPGPMPLFYAGVALDFPCGPDEVCERWAGPTGDTICHVHLRDNERWDSHAGGDVIRRNSDPGRAYMMLASTTPYWVECSIQSFMQRFEGATHRSATQLDGKPDSWGILNPFEEPISDRDRREIEHLRSERPWKHVESRPTIDFADRFLTKLALGLGYNILGRRAMDNPYAHELRKSLWTSDAEARESLEVRGTGFFYQHGDDRAYRFLEWKGVWVVMLNAFSEGFTLNIITPGGRHMSITLSIEPALWPANVRQTYGSGQIYFIVPQRALSVGPVTMVEYISFKNGRRSHPGLHHLRSLEVDISDLPPKR